MPQALFALRVLMFFLATGCLTDAEEFHVSLKGNDAWSGLLAEPNPGGTDGPFATFERARNALRKVRERGASGPHCVNVREGHYALASPVVLQSEDSGSEGEPVVWQSFNNELVVIAGTVRPQGWTKWKGEIMAAPFSGGAKDAGGIRQALLNGERQILARYPNFDPDHPVSGGWAFAEGDGWPMYAEKPGEDKRSLEVREKDLRVWAKPEAVEITVFPRYNWFNSRVPVKSVDVSAKKIFLAKETAYGIRQFDRYYFQNALEELDAPGEWYFDQQEGQIYYWPPAGKRAEELSVVVARTLVQMEKGTHDVVWRGFTMEGCNGTAIQLTETTRCLIEKNHIRSVGDWNGHGVQVTGGSHNAARRNRIEGAGNCGIMLSGGVYETLTRASNAAEHNEISHFGVYYKQGVGVNLNGVGCIASHNHISHGPRFGIIHRGSVHDIGYNHIHDVCLETEDTGAIYSNGRDWLSGRGTAIHHNYIHDIPGFSMWEGKPVTPNFAWGIYLDDGTGGADVIGNIVVRCGRGGIHAHSARDSLIRNNIFADNHDWQVDVHGWTKDAKFWVDHLKDMVRGYERVASSPQWSGIRGIGLHPTEIPLPNGLTTRGNVVEANIMVSHRPDVAVMDVVRIPFEYNRFDHNLFWAPGGNVIIDDHAPGEDQGANLASPFEGSEGKMPDGWRWGGRFSAAKAVLKKNGDTALLELSVDENDQSVKSQPLIFGGDVSLEQGASYRLRARLKSSAAGKVQLGVQCYVPGMPFWTSPGPQIDVSPGWRDCENTFRVPKPGDKGWHEQMKTFSIRIGWKREMGVLEVSGLQLFKVASKSDWNAWRKNRVDEHSVVADPMFDDPKTFELSKQSPAWKLGFERIPFEQIGPQP